MGTMTVCMAYGERLTVDMATGAVIRRQMAGGKFAPCAGRAVKGLTRLGAFGHAGPRVALADHATIQNWTTKGGKPVVALIETDHGRYLPTSRVPLGCVEYVRTSA